LKRKLRHGATYVQINHRVGYSRADSVER